jgi:hypothetical protein
VPACANCGCDLTGSTALGETLDPERLRALLARYFERMSDALMDVLQNPLTTCVEPDP